MNTPGKLRPLRGIIPPLATPLASIDELDLPGLERLIEHVLRGGVHGLFILGTTGEGPALSYRLRREVIERVCAQVGTRVPVLVGITDSAYIESLQLAEVSAKAGAAAVVAATPFYFRFGQSEILRLVESLAKDSSLPVFLYNQPELTKISFEPKTVARAAEIPNVVGVKDSGGQIGYIKQVLSLLGKSHPEFSVLVGSERLLAEALLCGAHGGVPGGANIFPDLPVRLYQAFVDGRRQEMQELQAKIIEIGAPIWNIGEEEPAFLGRLKGALAAMGICSGLPTWPYRQVTAEQGSKILEHLKKHGISRA
jgi:dihydrodipicolinate synthase/N-acetylneuraminate lyase